MFSSEQWTLFSFCSAPSTLTVHQSCVSFWFSSSSCWQKTDVCHCGRIFISSKPHAYSQTILTLQIAAFTKDESSGIYSFFFGYIRKLRIIRLMAVYPDVKEKPRVDREGRTEGTWARYLGSEKRAEVNRVSTKRRRIGFHEARREKTA